MLLKVIIINFKLLPQIINPLRETDKEIHSIISITYVF